ncbi:MAG TPA: hypothetical protein VF807_08635 [Ktedonobacterales bacterium]
MLKRAQHSLILLLATFAATALFAGCSLGAATTAAPTPTATTEPTATPLLNTTYTSTNGVYTLIYSSKWTVKPISAPLTSGTAQLTDSTSTDLFIVEPFVVKSTATYPSLLKAWISKAPFTSSTVDTTVTTKTLPNGSWTVASGKTVISSVPFTAHLYGMLHDGHTFIVMTFAPTATQGNDQTTYFDPMLSSLTFLK